MLLSDDISSFRLLYDAVQAYYRLHGDRALAIFDEKPPGDDDKYYIRFLVDRKHVVEYAIVKDRGFNLSGVSLAIGPHYFGAADFWSYKNSERFTLEASTGAIESNLKLLDEFWGYDSKVGSTG